MSRDNILQWRPRSARHAALEPTLLWAVHKQLWKIECLLQASDHEAWDVRVLLNGEWFFSCRFPSLDDARRAADEKHAELLGAGWASAAATAEGH
jgi:hypothetical protein